MGVENRRYDKAVGSRGQQLDVDNLTPDVALEHFLVALIRLELPLRIPDTSSLKKLSLQKSRTYLIYTKNG
ncbi:MAG: hypothetical protein KME54_11920 [Tolypothrix brevis GSE-NOS-MK-07-07A]|nr:hypothetical protein [Tolypothrix brevis GSE-NOS-MK-07-07A]